MDTLWSFLNFLTPGPNDRRLKLNSTPGQPPPVVLAETRIVSVGEISTWSRVPPPPLIRPFSPRAIALATLVTQRRALRTRQAFLRSRLVAHLPPGPGPLPRGADITGEGRAHSVPPA